METNEIAAIGYAAGMLGFASLSALFLVRWKGGPYSLYLGLVSGTSAIWGCVLTLQSLGYLALGAVVVLAEWLRNAAWIVTLMMVVREPESRGMAYGLARRLGLPVVVVLLTVLVVYSNRHLDSLSMSLLVSVGIVMALVIISLLEQFFRSLPSDSTSSMKYVYVALFVVNAYDFFLFMHAITSFTIDADFWTARGYVNALLIVPLVVFGRRSALESVVNFPRQAAFYSISLLAISLVVVLWLATDHYVREYGGSFSSVAGIVLSAAALITLGVLLASATNRARTRVFLTKTFFQYKYDYRKEWLRFIGTLSESGLEHVPTTAVRAVAPIVNSPGGIVWIREHEGDEYLPVGSWRCELPIGKSFSRDSSLIRFLRDRQWVIDLNELKFSPSLYDDLQLDPWFAGRDDLWLVVPLLVGKRLFGFIVLLKPRLVPTLNFEDHDLLKTVGRHVGTHIKQADSDKRLAESSQFRTYHRLSAFLMHDLNNLIAQQSLVVENAEKFRHNPKFVDDTIDTIAHSVARMRRLMEQLSGKSKTPKSSKVSMRHVLENAVLRSEPRLPVPTLSIDDGDLFVTADPDRLSVVIEHLIRNAQDATDQEGSIGIITSSSNGAVTIAISDTGCGMTPEFISERLFRPFDSTKGSQSMGIGAYQAREYVRMLRGQLEVSSAVGRGTTISLRLPVAD